MSFGHKELELPLTTKCGVLEPRKENVSRRRERSTMLKAIER